LCAHKRANLRSRRKSFVTAPGAEDAARGRLPDGNKVRISGTSPKQFNTRLALQAERDHVQRLREKKEVPPSRSLEES
jgi:hypothetical protein